MTQDVVIFNFSSVYEIEPFRNVPQATMFDCANLEGTKCYCDECGEKELRGLIETYPANGIHFLDNGDYHYITRFWTDKISEPWSLVVFDNHTDMQEEMFGMLSCGSWVKSVLDRNHWLKDVVIIGAQQELIDQVPTEYAQRARFFSRESIMSNPEVINLLLNTHFNYPCYISIDKDVLDSNSAATNWEQGSMSLVQLSKILKAIVSNNSIIGVDVCGECPINLPLPELYRACHLNNVANQNILDIFFTVLLK